MKSGICFVFGNTNVGKSTLINKIVGKKVSIVSDKPDTTRVKMLALYKDDNAEIAFLDAPGINDRSDFFSKRLNEISLGSIKGNDLIYFVVEKPYTEKYDKLILDSLIAETKGEDTPVFLIINKIDELKMSGIDEIILSYKDLYPFKEIIPISAKTEKHLDILINKTLEYFSESEYPLFGEDFFTTQSVPELVTEYVREKVFYFTDREIPYSVGVSIDHREKKKDKEIYYISIFVLKESQKKIVIGKGGETIKKIRELAERNIRKELEDNIRLELFVKVNPDWKNKINEVNKINLGE